MIGMIKAKDSGNSYNYNNQVRTETPTFAYATITDRSSNMYIVTTASHCEETVYALWLE